MHIGLGTRILSRHCVGYARRGSTIICNTSKKLVLYSKPGCHLCDGLKEKLDGLLTKAEYMESGLTGVPLEVRDIMTNPSWEARFALEIPVLAWELHDGSEVQIPRAPPRTTGPRLQKIIEDALPHAVE